MNKLLKISIVALVAFSMSACNEKQQENEQANIEEMNQQTTLTQEWDKTFPQSDMVDHKKVTFKNRFGIELVADMYTPKNAEGKLAAIAVSGPYGAVKEQSSGLYAQTLAERGFVTIAFDPSYTGESSGEPRYVSSPDINTEDFMAAVDFLSLQENVDRERIGILGVCGWGGIALNTAAIDPRIKATVASTMYDMTRVTQNGYYDSADNKEARNEARKAMAEQRLTDIQNGSFERAGGVVDPLPEDAPLFVKQYHAYYKTPRGYHARSLNSNEGWLKTNAQPWMNAGYLKFTNEIENAVMIVHGEKAHSRYFGETAFDNMTGSTHKEGESAKVGNKELLIVPNATHCDLYDGGEENFIPFDKIVEFYNNNLK